MEITQPVELRSNGAGYDVWYATKKVGKVYRDGNKWAAATVRGRVLAHFDRRRDAYRALIG